MAKIAEKYEDLEDFFKVQVKKDGCDSIYLPPIIRPEEIMDFIFIGMEPSLGSWAKGRTPEDKIKDAKQKIAAGFKDFSYSLEDFILHYCIRKYLCNDENKYYITNISKGAMLTKYADEKRPDRYKRWLPFLIKEISILSSNATKLVSIGQYAKELLSKEYHQLSVNSILHYSGRWPKHRDKFIIDNGLNFESFQKNNKDIITNGILKVINEITDASNIQLLSPSVMDFTNRKKDLTESQLKLILVYKNQFEDIKSK
jgi:hypothetical protein